MTIRRATPKEINDTFQRYRERVGRPLFFEEVEALDASLARVIERDDKKDIKHRLAFMLQGMEAQDGFQWNDYVDLCRDALAEIERLQDMGLSMAAKLTTMECITLPTTRSFLERLFNRYCARHPEDLKDELGDQIATTLRETKC